MEGDLPITRIDQSASASPTSTSVTAPIIVSLQQTLDHETAVWARIRAEASQRYQEYQDKKKREQDRVEKARLILRQQQEALDRAQAEFEALSTLATAVSVSVPITVSWEREGRKWAQIRAQAAERYEKYQLEREREQEVAEHDEHLPILPQQHEAEREEEQDLAEHDEHLPSPPQQQVAKRNSKMSMVSRWLSKVHRLRATSVSEQA